MTNHLNNLPDSFYIALAIGVKPLQEILEMYDLTQEDAALLQADPQFQKNLLLAKDAVETDGTAFFARCRLLAGETLHKVTEIISDPANPAAIQLDAWKTLVKYGRLEPTPATANFSGPQLTFTIIAPQGETVVSTQLTNTAALPHYPPVDDDYIDYPNLPVGRISASDLGFA